MADEAQQKIEGERDEELRARPFNPLRVSNAITAAFLACYFLLHALLGTIEIASQWRGAFEWAVWIGVGVIGVHIALSIATTVSMFTDKVRPASPRKRQHQMLKWMTGIALLICIFMHIASRGIDVDAPRFTDAATAVIVLAALVWHFFVGVKSFTHDLRISSKLRTPARAIVAVAAAALALALLIAVTALAN